MTFSGKGFFGILWLLVWCSPIFLQAYDHDMYIAPGEKDEKTSTTTQIIKDSVKIKKSKNKLSPVDSSKEDDKNKILENIDLFTHSQSHYMPKGNFT